MQKACHGGSPAMVGFVAKSGQEFAPSWVDALMGARVWCMPPAHGLPHFSSHSNMMTPLPRSTPNAAPRHRTTARTRQRRPVAWNYSTERQGAMNAILGSFRQIMSFMVLRCLRSAQESQTGGMPIIGGRQDSRHFPRILGVAELPSSRRININSELRHLATSPCPAPGAMTGPTKILKR